MRITATQIGLGACLLAILTQCQGLTKVYEETQARGEKTAEIRTEIADNRIEARELAKRSDVAIERLKAGCSPIGVGGYAQPFREGEAVASANGAPLPDGSFVCNALGWTARVKAIQGISTMESLALVAPSDASKFFELFQSLPGLNPVLQPPPTAAPTAPQPLPAAPPPLPAAPSALQLPPPAQTTTTVKTDV